jgi:uncharacterized caspase-like protein
MVKIALLIGISEYKPGLSPLPGCQKDIQSMQRVLLHQGGFDKVDLLQNPELMEMSGAIEALFRYRHPDDLILLYFSGHGITETDGSLYFATRQTIIDGKLVTSTAVDARSIQRFMRNSSSTRQILILDCCFSGAFAKEMAAKGLKPEPIDMTPVDIEGQLGGEGRVVLTSSSDTQSSYENEDGGIYTFYLVQGMESGAVDTDDDGWITVRELHDFAKSKTHRAKPTMKPEIYSVGEGFNIRLMKTPEGDPKIEYRKEVELLARDRNGEFRKAILKGLEEKRKAYNLSTEEAEAIQSEVLQPY